MRLLKIYTTLLLLRLLLNYLKLLLYVKRQRLLKANAMQRYVRVVHLDVDALEVYDFVGVAWLLYSAA